MPEAIPHKDPQDPEHRHGLNIVFGTLMERVYGDAKSASTACHMAIDEVADGFMVTARCPDGVIEAIESTEGWFALGTQFHPESESATALDVRIFE
jgi:putative glutamine amidotransferase